MRHSVFGRKLSRTKNERKRLLQGLVRDIILHGTIRTTIAKAKAVQPLVETCITKAKKATRSGIIELSKVIGDKKIEQILLEDAKTRFASRQSGFTRIIHLGKRLGDATEEAYLQLVDEKVQVEVVKPKESKVVEAEVVENKPAKKTATKKTAVKKTVKK